MPIKSIRDGVQKALLFNAATANGVAKVDVTGLGSQWLRGWSWLAKIRR
ncbi:MAG TPA: hypothetical protein VGF76_18205 [Polyangiaceae bacterium]|jgi:hypothetical protein